jgi:2-amino-4-hydroxy-6-hydroxymethyldihydropteridine diphosphokinase
MWHLSSSAVSQNPLPEVLLGLGSNCRPEFHIKKALEWLRSEFGSIERSVVYESAAVGFAGDPFHNLVVAIQCSGGLTDLRAAFKALEDQYGRDRQQPKFSSRNIDLDILTYGSLFGCHHGLQLPRPDCFVYSYVLKPLAELRPHQLVPGRTLTWEQLWERHAPQAQTLTSVEWQYSHATQSPKALSLTD